MNTSTQRPITVPCRLTRLDNGEICVVPLPEKNDDAVDLPLDLVQKYMDSKCFHDFVQGEILLASGIVNESEIKAGTDTKSATPTSEESK